MNILTVIKPCITYQLTGLLVQGFCASEWQKTDICSTAENDLKKERKQKKRNRN